MKHTFRNVISKLHNLTETEGDRRRREGQSQSDTGGRGREGLREGARVRQNGAQGFRWRTTEKEGGGGRGESRAHRSRE